jgi:hypothetical protein
MPALVGRWHYFKKKSKNLIFNMIQDDLSIFSERPPGKKFYTVGDDCLLLS